MSQAFGEVELTKAVSLLERLNGLAGRLCGDEPAREGGYFCLVENASRTPYTTHLVGRVAEGKKEKYFLFAQEKALRLAGETGHRTSWQSRNEAEKRWGGAIDFIFRRVEVVISFSGYRECWDEALMLVLAISMDWLALEEARSIAHETTRPCMQALLAALDTQSV